MIKEADVYAALGMEVPAKQPEVAEPAALTGENGQGVTDPAGAKAAEGNGTRSPSSALRAPSPQGEGFGGQNAGASEEGEEDMDEAAGEPGEAEASDAEGNLDQSAKQPMSKAERARQAQLRREREKQAAVDAAVKAERERLNSQHQAELEEVFAKAGMTDRYNNGAPIKTMEEFRSWNSKAEAAGLSRRLQEGKLTAEDFQAAVDNSPAVKAARAAVERLEAREQEQKQEEYREMVNRELEEIKTLDPSVTSLNDILNRENGQEFARLVQENHLSFTQAFKLTNGERMAKAQAMAAAEGAARRQHGKDHMRSVVTTGGDVMDVPRATVELFRQMNPGITMEEIRQEYARWTPGKK